MRQPPGNRVFYRVVNVIPAHLKALCYLLSTHPTSPASQEPFVLGRQRTFAFRPWNPLNLDATRRPIHATHRIHQHDRNHPQRNEVETTSLGLCVIPTASLATTRARRQPILSCTHGDLDRRLRFILDQLDMFHHKRLVFRHAIEDSFQLHPVGTRSVLISFQTHLTRNRHRMRSYLESSRLRRPFIRRGSPPGAANGPDG